MGIVTATKLIDACPVLSSSGSEMPMSELNSNATPQQNQALRFEDVGKANARGSEAFSSVHNRSRALIAAQIEQGT